MRASNKVLLSLSSSHSFTQHDHRCQQRKHGQTMPAAQHQHASARPTLQDMAACVHVAQRRRVEGMHAFSLTSKTVSCHARTVTTGTLGTSELAAALRSPVAPSSREDFRTSATFGVSSLELRRCLRPIVVEALLTALRPGVVEALLAAADGGGRMKQELSPRPRATRVELFRAIRSLRSRS